MFVGYTGVARIVQRTCEAMNEAGIEDPYDAEAVRVLGVIDLPTIQPRHPEPAGGLPLRETAVTTFKASPVVDLDGSPE